MPLSTLKPRPKFFSPGQDPVERPVIPVNLRRLHVDKPDEDDIYEEMDRDGDNQISAELEALGVHV